MKYLKTFESKKTDENKEKKSKIAKDKYIKAKDLHLDDIMGKLLRLYSSIPVPKEKATIVIGKILNKYNIETYKDSEGYLGYFNISDSSDIDLPNLSDKYTGKVGLQLRDRVRFKDYFDSFLNDKEIRGHNFEGLLSGIFGAKLETNGVKIAKNSKYDLVIPMERTNGTEDLKCSVKFVDFAGKSPELGKFKDIIKKANEDGIISNEEHNIIKNIGLTNLYSSNDDNTLKEKIFQLISFEINCWIIAYPSVKNDANTIAINIISKKQMKEILMNGLVISPKAGLSDKFSLALGSAYLTSTKYYTQRHIIIPDIKLDELESELKNKWAEDVFGTSIVRRIRPDVLKDIEENAFKIITKMKTYLNLMHE